MLKKLIFPLFILIALIQLATPIKSIYNQEQILANGKEFKFKTAPVDPNDPFRGKFVTLRFKENTIKVAPYKKWNRGEEIFASIEENEHGFAQLLNVSKEAPSNHKYYILAKIQRIITTKNENNKISNVELQIQYPFNRFYMEESKAKAAEDLYRKASANKKTLSYALVNIKNGKATLKDVMIDGVSIREVIINDN